MTDRRLTPANGRVAHDSLRGLVEAARYVAGEAAAVIAPVTDILACPGGPRDRQMLLGDGVRVLDRHRGYAFIQSLKDGYCGYVAEATLGPPLDATHWVAAPASHLYAEASIKGAASALISLGSRLRIVGETGALSETGQGLFVPSTHLRPVGSWATDPAAVAESLIGTPYLWGGNSRSGIDCSGLVQAALLACNFPCPGDTDMQERAVGSGIPQDGPFRRNDLFFWRGHVAMAVDDTRLIHANGWRMSVTHEDIAAAVGRIAAQDGTVLTSVRRFWR